MSHSSSVNILTRLRVERSFFRGRGTKFACAQTGPEFNGACGSLGKADSFSAVKAAGALSSI